MRVKLASLLIIMIQIIFTLPFQSFAIQTIGKIPPKVVLPEYPDTSIDKHISEFKGMEFVVLDKRLSKELGYRFDDIKGIENMSEPLLSKIIGEDKLKIKYEALVGKKLKVTDVEIKPKDASVCSLNRP